MTEFDNTYTVIPMLHIDTGKVVYSVLKLDGHSFPDAGVYSTKEAAQKVADMKNEEDASGVSDE